MKVAFLEDIYIQVSIFLWRDFFIVWGPGNSQGQILTQFSTSQSPKTLQAEVSSQLDQLDAHSWDFVSPEK